MDRTSDDHRNADFLLLFAHRGDLEQCFEEHPGAYSDLNREAWDHVQKSMSAHHFTMAAETASFILKMAKAKDVLDPVLHKREVMKYWVSQNPNAGHPEFACYAPRSNPPAEQNRIISMFNMAARPLDTYPESPYIDEPLYFTPSVRMCWERTKDIVEDAKRWRTLSSSDVYFLALVLDQPFFSTSYSEGSISEWSCFVHQLFADNDWRTYVH